MVVLGGGAVSYERGTPVGAEGDRKEAAGGAASRQVAGGGCQEGSNRLFPLP